MSEAYVGEIRPANRQALMLLEAWLNEPDDLGDAWWDVFVLEQQDCRLCFDPPQVRLTDAEVKP